VLFNRFALTEFRELRKMAKGTLAKESGQSAAYITLLEKGDRENPSLTVLGELAQTLDVDSRALYLNPSIDRLIDELISKINGDRSALDLAIKMLTRVRNEHTK
jgi:transcriptional regulator with XRE-family HTH domain